eukprot:scaffold39301_cov63-Phaeocystis_antarctica.AAC.2
MSTTLPRLVRWISGMALSSSSLEVGPLGVQSEALARRDGALVDRGLGGVQSLFRGLGDGRHDERLHAHLRVVRVRLEYTLNSGLYEFCLAKPGSVT